MLSVGLVVLLAQAPACTGQAAASMAEGGRLASALALPDAAARYEAAAAAGCDEARVAALYLAGLMAAREAYRAGGSPSSLVPVRQAESRLEEAAAAGRPVAEIARVLLMAAAAAAMSERDEMGTLLTHATQLERLRIAGGVPGVPGVTAHELAGDLWLQVHRFEDARAAYRQAADLTGLTPRIASGLARAAVRLQDTAGACEAYRSLVRLWRAPREAPEVVEARAFLDRDCQPGMPARGAPAPE